jgi:hypothetical protein
MTHWLAHILGLDDPSGGWLWWSGFGADLGMLTAVGAFARHVNCHEHGCWRLGKHPVDGTPFKVCRVHHPDLP